MIILAARDELWAAVDTFDSEQAELALKHLFEGIPLSEAVATVVLPFLQDVGDRWEAGTLSVAHEHFASELVRRRLVKATGDQRVARKPPDAPVVVLACPAGERHDMVLLCVALMLGERGVRVLFLGANTPAGAITTAARGAGAHAIVLAASRQTALTAQASALRRIAADHRLYVAGRGVDAQTAKEVGATLLTPDPVRAVAELSDLLHRRGPSRGGHAAAPGSPRCTALARHRTSGARANTPDGESQETWRP